jgi:hypothetical protein
VLTIAAQFYLLAGLLTVIAAVLSEGTVRLNDALTRRVGTLRGFGHLVPPSNAARLYASAGTWNKLGPRMFRFVRLTSAHE